MTGLARILVATDLSAPARHAAERAVLIGKEVGATLDLVHVVNPAPLERLRRLTGAPPADVEQRVLDSAGRRLRELAATLGKHGGAEPAARVLAGALLAELRKAIDGLPAGLLVCGAKGDSAIRHLTLGTTALRMLETSTCPVLVVKQRPHEPYRRILVAVDHSPSSLRAVRNARDVAPQAEIVLLHVYDAPFEGHLRFAGVSDEIIRGYRNAERQEAARKLDALRDEAGLPSLRCRPVVVQGDPGSRIVEEEQESDCDLIVLGKHGAGALESLLLGSVTKRVLAESQGDVLVSV